MTPGAASVIIVSRGRPGPLRHCLLGLDQQDHPEFEIVVVADAEGIGMVGQMGWSGRVKAIQFDEANVSVARNEGIAAAAAPVIAFIDDDAVPEHDWLRRLTAPITAGRADAAGGYVIGRNGISFQWTAREILADTTSTELALDPEAETILSGAPGRGIKTEGTNMAFRRDLLCEVGGFDPGYRYYLDETDLDMRLAERGVKTAIVPRARVHHGFAASERRRGDRVPRDLAPVGASLALFLRRHGAEVDANRVKATERSRLRKALLAHMVAGRLLPTAVEPILRTFDAGWMVSPATSAPEPLTPESTGFHPFTPRIGADAEHRAIQGWLGQIRPLRRTAIEAAKTGQRVTLYVFSFTSFYHRRTFREEGYWEQRGGLFGRSMRSDPVFRVWRRAERVRREEALQERL